MFMFLNTILKKKKKQIPEIKNFLIKSQRVCPEMLEMLKKYDLNN